MTDAERLKAHVVERLAPLRSAGFTNFDSTESSNAGQVEISLSSTAVQADRQLVIDIRFGPTAREGTAVLWLGRVSDDGGFLLSHFAKRHKVPPPPDRFGPGDSSATLTALLDALCDWLLAFSAGPFASFLSGETWERVPFDWDGYR